VGAEVVKPNVKKVRRIGSSVIGGFAGASSRMQQQPAPALTGRGSVPGATADAFTLFERLEGKLEEHPARDRGWCRV